MSSSSFPQGPLPNLPPFPEQPARSNASPKFKTRHVLEDQPKEHTSLYSLDDLYVNIIIYLSEVEGYTPERLKEEVVETLYGDKPCNLQHLDTELSELCERKKRYHDIVVEKPTIKAKRCFDFLRQDRETPRYEHFKDFDYTTAGLKMHKALGEVIRDKKDPKAVGILVGFNFHDNDPTHG
ncbi:MAG: hypothetical protein Q9212_002324 [Teloschistes hypoglaucus]